MIATRQADSPVLPADVWAGWLSEFLDWVQPSTDAAIEGIFAAASVSLGLAIGRSTGINYGRPTHPNLYVNIIGATGVPRKSTILSRLQTVLRAAHTEEFVRCPRSIGSAEGLLEYFCREELDDRPNRTNLVPVSGQRVVLFEPEFTGLLKKARRPGTANICETLLVLYDGDDLSPRTRVKPIVVREPFFCLVTSTTPDNLQMSLTDTDIESGLVPRFASFYCTPREPLAYPPKADEELLKRLVKGLQDISRHASDLGSQPRSLELTPEAAREWELIFRDITTAMRTAPVGSAAVMARVPTQIMKWALLYALQATRAEVTTEDLARATLVGTYLMETARLVPGMVERTRISRVEAKIEETLRRVDGKYLTASEIHRLVSGRIKADDLRKSLDALVNLGVIDGGTSQGGVKAYRLAKGSNEMCHGVTVSRSALGQA